MSMPFYSSRQSQCLFPGPRTTFWWEMGQKICGCALKLPLLSCSALLSILALPALPPSPEPSRQDKPNGPLQSYLPSLPKQLQKCTVFSTSGPFLWGAVPLVNWYPQASAWLPHLLIGLSEDRHGYRSQVPKEHSSFVGLRDDQDGWGALVHGLEMRLGL